MRALALPLLLAAGTCLAGFEPPARLIVTTDDNYPPYLFRDAGGELRGITRDKWELWSARTRIPVRIHGTTWTRAQELARDGGADVIDAIAFTEARRTQYEFSPPYATIDARVFFHQSVSGIHDVASMRGFTIGAKEGSACGRWLEDRSIHTRAYPTSEALVDAAGAGDVRVFCMDSPTARYFLYKAGKADEFRETEPLYSASLHWAVRAGQADLRNFIQAGFARISPDELNAIESRWMGTPLALPFDSRYVVYLLFAAALVVASGVLLLAWNRSLRARVATRTAELRDALDAAAREARSARDLYDNAPCGYHSLDADGVYVEVNATELAWLGTQREELIGRMRFSDFLTEEGKAAFRANFPRFLEMGELRDLEYDLVRKDGTTMRVLLSATLQRDAKGRPTRSNATLYDITARAEAEERMAHMAHHDALTGLPNRSLLRDRLQQAIARAHRAGAGAAVICIDVDRFKTLNDSLGHSGGDWLLQAVGRRLAESVREGDTLSRIGDDCFVALMPEVRSAQDASAMARAFLDGLARSFRVGEREVHLTASVGIALYPNDGANAETLIRNAETAMVHAKDAGRANYQFFARHMNVAVHERLALEEALRRGIEQGQFELAYQPIVAIRTGELQAVEALLRWRPSGRVVAPADFIGVAEESGLIVPIGEWALREALTRARAWHASRPDLGISVNVSACQLARPDFCDRLTAIVAETGVDPRRLEIEITETAILESGGLAREALERLAELGVGIAIDDFGTGYAGIAYLKRLPVPALQIDQSFVRNLADSPEDAAIVGAMIGMARGLGVGVVAEGVETEAQRAELMHLGCERAQGFLWSAAVEPERIARMLMPRAAQAAVAD